MFDFLALADGYAELITWLLVLMGSIIVLGLGLWYYRRRWLFAERQPDAAPWTLADIRRLRDSGNLTEEEYQRIRASMIGALGAAEGKAGTAGSAGRRSGPPSDGE